MRSTHPVPRPHRVTQASLIMLVLGLTLLISACGGDPRVQQQSGQARARLDQLLQQAQLEGVPVSTLAPVTRQEKQLNGTGAPFSPFNDQTDTQYYTQQASQYAKLIGQTQQLLTSTTNQDQLQAENDLQVFAQALASRNKQHIGNLQPFTDQYNNDKLLISSAKFPKDYAAISQQAQAAITTLGVMGQAYTQLSNFKNTIGQMQQAHIDVTAMSSQYSNDLRVFNNTTTTPGFQNLTTTINSQYQLAVVNSIAALPYVSSAKLNEFKTQIGLLKTYGMSTTPYQPLYNRDQTAMQKARTIQDYLAFSNRIDADMASMHDDLVQGASSYMIGALDRAANAWGKAHLFHDKVDGKNYILDSGYTMNGIGYWLQRELGWAYTPADFQSVVTDDNNEFFNLKMMQQDYSDKTPYSKVHATDTQLISRYHLTGQIIVVSMVEQAMRIYQNGKLVKFFHVTTGRVERPVLPGYWTVQNRQSPTEFKSDDPPGSPFWYPPTPIHYAILYHWGGFFIHDAWWRETVGPGTQFPHNDAGGDTSFNYDGSHGCVNMLENDAAWVYANTNWNTQIVIY